MCVIKDMKLSKLLYKMQNNKKVKNNKIQSKCAAKNKKIIR